MEPIIKAYMTELNAQMDEDILKVCHSYGIDVNKERLTQALTDARKFCDEGYRAGKLDAGPKWISVKDRLPEPEQLVLVQCVTKPSSFKYQCLAFYVPKKWLREASNFCWDYECCDEYDEEADDYYVNEGWYERIYNWDDYNAVGIGDFVTHWMPLPEPPKEV